MITKRRVEFLSNNLDNWRNQYGKSVSRNDTFLDMATRQVAPVLEDRLRMSRCPYKEQWRADTGCCAVTESKVDQFPTYRSELLRQLRRQPRQLLAHLLAQIRHSLSNHWA